MYRSILRYSAVAVLKAVVVASLVLPVHARTFVPGKEIGNPVGLIPECPDITKNATITPDMIPKFTIVSQRLKNNGHVFRKLMPYTNSVKMVTSDKHIDLKHKRTVFYAIGYVDSSIFPQSIALGNTYSKMGYNFFITETLPLFSHIYPQSVRLAQAVGIKIGEFLFELTKHGLRAENLELVGLSLGTQIVSFAAKHFYKLSGKKPARLTGLDPSGPCLRSLPQQYRFNSDDAVHVDAIHTNIDGFGIAETVGHVDFYVNGGEYQPADSPHIPCLVICSHIKVILYWWQALDHPRDFIAMKCDSIQDARTTNCYGSSETNLIGPLTNFSRPGIFYLSTYNEFPYYRGVEGLDASKRIIHTL